MILKSISQELQRLVLLLFFILTHVGMSGIAEFLEGAVGQQYRPC
jgi:hypothetical protein